MIDKVHDATNIKIEEISVKIRKLENEKQEKKNNEKKALFEKFAVADEKHEHIKRDEMEQLLMSISEATNKSLMDAFFIEE